MNGLKYIRTKCNLSSSDLAEVLGVTRQAISAWENETKDIPEQRLAQLSDYFGINPEYFGEICDEEAKYIDDKAMYRHSLHGKEIYRMVPDASQGDCESQIRYFDSGRKVSLNEELKAAQNIKEEALARISEIIDWNNNADISSKIMHIHRNCNIYGMISELLELAKSFDSTLKITLLYEITDVLKALLLAHGLLDRSELEFKGNCEYVVEDGEWIINLAEQIRNHWECESESETKRFEQAKANLTAYRKSSQLTEN